MRDALLGAPCRATATGWSSAPRPRRLLAPATSRWASDFPVFLHPQTGEEVRAGAHRAQDGAGLPRLRLPRRARGHAGRRPGAARPDHQRHRAGRGRHADRPLRRPARPRGARAAPCVRRLRRRPGAHPAAGALRGALRRLHAWRPRRMALLRRMVAAGEVDALVPERVWQELSRGLMERAARAACSRCCATAARWRGCCPRWTACGACRSRAEHHPEVDTGVHLMLVLDMCARLAAPLPVRFACLVPRPGQGHDAAPTSWPRHIGHEGAQRGAGARGWPSACACPPTAANWPTWWRASTATCTAAASLDAAARAAPARALRRAAPAGAFRRGAAGLRMRRARPRRARGRALSAARAPAAALRRRWRWTPPPSRPRPLARGPAGPGDRRGACTRGCGVAAMAALRWRSASRRSHAASDQLADQHRQQAEHQLLASGTYQSRPPGGS